MTTRVGIGPRIWGLVRPWRARLGAVSALVVADSLVLLVPPLVVRSVVNHDLVPHRTTGLALAGVVYVLAVASDGLLAYGYSYAAARVSQAAIAALRTRLFSHLLSLPVSYFDKTPMGDAISRATADVETVDSLFTDGIVTLVGQLVPLVAIAVAMVALSAPLSAVAAISIPPLYLIARFLQRRVRDAERQTRRAVGRLNIELAESVGGAETIRVFGRTGVFASRFRASLTRTLRAQDRSIAYNSFFAPLTGLLSATVIALLLWIGGGASIASTGVNLGTLIAFVLLFQAFFAPLLALGDEWQSVQAALAGVERVFEILDLDVEAPTCSSAARHGPGIVVEDVWFSFLTGRPVLRGVSLRVAPGEIVTVVGRTGSGKSTLVSLIAGLHAPDSGSISVNGADPRTLNETERRRVLGVMTQTSPLFSGSVRDNISLFDSDVDDAQVGDALDLTGIRAMVDQLPEGLDTRLAASSRGEGLVLSTGQRQLLALARTIVARPTVLVLDEATAAVDGASDASFRAALRAVAVERGCAVLMVAHRIATAREADRVVVVDRGSIVEVGTPTSLIAAQGYFAALADLEAAGWDWHDVEEPRVPVTRSPGEEPHA